MNDIYKNIFIICINKIRTFICDFTMSENLFDDTPTPKFEDIKIHFLF